MTGQPDLEGLGFETNAVHGGESADAATGAVNTPVYLSSTFQQDAVGQHRGFEYARSGNPSRASLERHLALLEGADFGFAFASGLAAEDAVMRLLSPATISSCRLTATEERSDWPPRSTARPGWLSTPSTSPTWMRCGDRRRAWCGSNHRRIRCSTSSTSPPYPPPPTVGEPSSSSTTPLPRRGYSNLSAWEPTSSCTRPPSTSVATPTSSGALPPPTTRTSRLDSGSFRMRPAPFPGPSTASSCSVGSRRWAYGWNGTAPMLWPSSSS